MELLKQLLIVLRFYIKKYQIVNTPKEKRAGKNRIMRCINLRQ